MAVAACRPGERALRTPDPAPQAGVESPHSSAQFFEGSPDEGFWVTHDVYLDRVVHGGARLEVTPSGEIVSATWDARGDPVRGSLAVAPHLGGGFVHWTAARVFRSREFTGPLSPIASGMAGEVGIHGARNGLGAVFVATTRGPLELAPGSARLTPLRDAGVVDLAATSASHAVVLDVFGRGSTTADGGRTWVDVSSALGRGARHLVTSGQDLWIDTPHARLAVDARGRVAPTDLPTGNGAEDIYQRFSSAPRGLDRDALKATFGEKTALQVAVAAGGAIGDGTAFAVARSGIARVDLRSGKLVSIASEVFPPGLDCQPVPSTDGVLFACTWDRFRGYGGYVFRSVAGEPPRLDHAFSDDGSFVADGEGALGFMGSCAANLRVIDPQDSSRSEAQDRDRSLPPVLCVRQSTGEWVERRIEVESDHKLVAWVPRRDGTAAALLLSTAPLPPPARGGPRTVEQGGVTAIHVYPEIPGWAFGTPSWGHNPRGDTWALVNRRFRARDDGSIDGWLGPQQSLQSGAFVVGVTIDREGFPTLHEVPPLAVASAVGGRFGVSISRDGDLYESVDHGRTWTSAGVAPIAASGIVGECSTLGCTLDALVRVGYGRSSLSPVVTATPVPPPEPAPPLPRLSCAPTEPLIPSSVPPKPAGEVVSVDTHYGETLEFIREAVTPEASPAAPAGRLTAPTKKAGGSPNRGRPGPAILRTQTLVFRPPFEPHGPLRFLNATNVPPRYPPIVRTAVLAASGQIHLLGEAEEAEVLVTRSAVEAFPLGNERRGALLGPGFSPAPNHELVLVDVGNRIELRDRGPGTRPPPILLDAETSRLQERAVTVGHRRDGVPAVLVFDGPAPTRAGAAVIDAKTATPAPVIPLAPWSTVVTADDPRCRNDVERDSFRAIVMIDASASFSLDTTALPGVSLGSQGMALVRWGVNRVCLEGLDVRVVDPARRIDGAPQFRLVGRWDDSKDRGAVLRTTTASQELSCHLEP